MMTVIFSGLVVVEAVGPKYMTQQQQQQSTNSYNTRSKRSSKQHSSHPWMLQQRSAVGGALQPPTTRQFLDQCVSFLDLFEAFFDDIDTPS